MVSRSAPFMGIHCHYTLRTKWLGGLPAYATNQDCRIESGIELPLFYHTPILLYPYLPLFCPLFCHTAMKVVYLKAFLTRLRAFLMDAEGFMLMALALIINRRF